MAVVTSEPDVARTLARCYRQTWWLVLGDDPTPATIAASPAFASFVASSYFRGTGRSLRPADERVGRFYLWACLAGDVPAVLREPTGRYQLGLELGRHLVVRVARATDHLAASIARGVYFVDPRDPSRLVLIGPDGRAARLLAAARSHLIAAGACDLDSLVRSRARSPVRMRPPSS